ncbi:hypothetical protein MUU74_02665 [Chryseobacterium daecheongense]|uniref:hypothetical protein n=1 Tax=Chryseobacterium daecheongense TaxID=192389 RepID=UPI001FD6FCC1|nr:hypothetical protein [Chryseobacterium daecheongense]UOU98861.1 hypothetical protein MUU74_02665 [Chryseobacterium daecheongense]
MKRNLMSRLLLLVAFLTILYSCRNDHFPDQETYNNSNKYNLASKTISLNESKHKSKLVSELGKAETQLKSRKTDASGKVVNYGNGVSIDTDNVIYIENGPNYHTYTFRITRENAPADAPVENLLLVPLPDGSYRELLVTYNLTDQEKQKILSGIGVDTKGKVTITELTKGTFNGGSQLAKTTCGYKEETYWQDCSEHIHNQSNVNEWVNCEASTKPSVYTVVYFRCWEEQDDVITTTPIDGGTSGGGGGSGNTSGGGGATVPPCDTSTIPLNPEPGLTDENGCPIGSPTLPNLGSLDNDPCFKTKTAITKANEVFHSSNVQQNMDGVLKGKLGASNEWTVALGQNPDGTYDATSAVEGTIDQSTTPSSQLPSVFIGDGHTHKGAGVPSGGDLYHMLNGMSTYVNFKYRFVYGRYNGTPEVYALIIHDMNLASAFLQQFPFNENYDPNTHGIKEGSELYYEIYKMKTIYNADTSVNTTGEYYDARAVGMAYILDKFNSGISIAKVDANGNLKKINASLEKINGTNDEKATISKCP